MTSRRIELPGIIVVLVFFLLSLISFSVSPSLAVSLPQGNSCYVYPSPASGDIAWAVYNMPADGTALVVIYNESGDMVSQVEEIKYAGVQQTGLDLFYFRKGIYICRITLTLNGGEKRRLKTFKFMVTK